MKNISILGSTGSIGKNALKVIRNLKSKFNVIALSANKNYKELINQIDEFKPKYISIGCEEGYKILKDRYKEITIFFGDEGLKNIGKLDETDILLTAVWGAIGIEATVEAIKKEKRIALANKETLVAGGDLIRKLLLNSKSEIIPVDSEHSAIYQSIKSGKESEVKKIILTASGGPFRTYTKDQLSNVSIEDALKHPNWSMGKKITVDSATLVNKGLEVIEAHYLFDVDYKDIEVVVHPESIIHSMVEFKDKSVIAQMGVPDMKLPIQYAFTYPDRIENNIIDRLDFKKLSMLSFEQPKIEIFKGLSYAYEAGRLGKSMPAVLNAANEEAVMLFLNKKIKFLDIYTIIEKMMNEHNVYEVNSVEDIKFINKEIRARVKDLY